jgi:hypothetical protein
MPPPTTTDTRRKLMVRKGVLFKTFTNQIEYYEELMIDSGTLLYRLVLVASYSTDQEISCIYET